MNRYIIRYYQRFPIDPKARWDILRAEVYAKTQMEAEFNFWNDGIEIIDTVKDETYIQPILHMMESLE